MRRRCSEEEKTILKKHRKAIVKGVVKGNSFMRILVRTAHGTGTRLIKDQMYKSRDRKRFLYGEIVEFCEGSKGCWVAAENEL